MRCRAALRCNPGPCREAGTIEIELEQLKGSVMSLVMAANSSAEGDTYRELSDAVLQVKGALPHMSLPHVHTQSI